MVAGHMATTVPVQTWGSMAGMVAEQKEFQEQTAEYLESKEVHDLFSHLMRSVLVHQPDNLYQHLRETLAQKPPLAVSVIGPPGINRGRYCAQLAADYGIAHIRVGTLLAAAVKTTPEIKEVMAAGKLVDDAVVIDLVRAEIRRCAKSGWVLDGFPRTKIQAQAICTRETGFPLDQVLLLHTTEKAIKLNFAAKFAESSLSEADREDLIDARFQQYQMHVISIAELFKNNVRPVEVQASEEGFPSVMETIRGNLPVRPFANVPLRPNRVCIIGACAAGKTTCARDLARQKGLVHVDVGHMLWHAKTSNGQQAIPPEWASDEELCELVGARLRATDCMRKGWVLDGFPRTQAQAEYLRLNHLWPSRMIHLRVSPEMSLKRTLERRIDPQTGMVYHKAPGSSPRVSERLERAPYDEKAKVEERCKTHEENVDMVMQTFRIVSSSIQVDEEEERAVLVKAIHRIDEALPSELAQDPSAEE